jgi:hypothetical protein
MPLRNIMSARLDPVDRAEYDRTLAAIRAQFDEATFAARWALGRAMPIAQVIGFALELPSTMPPPSTLHPEIQPT